jgi:hypothetical protein
MVTADASDAANRLLWRVPPADLGKTVLVKDHGNAAPAPPVEAAAVNETTAKDPGGQAEAVAAPADSSAPPPSQ